MKFYQVILTLLATGSLVSLSPDLMAAPANDLFANRILLEGSNIVISVDNTSATIEPGETVAIVGHTGAGKTTIISLLLRFYDVQ